MYLRYGGQVMICHTICRTDTLKDNSWQRYLSFLPRIFLPQCQLSQWFQHLVHPSNNKPGSVGQCIIITLYLILYLTLLILSNINNIIYQFYYLIYFVQSLFVPLQVVSVLGRMDGRMRIVRLSILTKRGAVC